MKKGISKVQGALFVDFRRYELSNEYWILLKITHNAIYYYTI